MGDNESSASIVVEPGATSEHARLLALIENLRIKWQQRQEDYRKVGASVDGAKICEEIAEELDHIRECGDEKVLMKEAAARSGYSREHLSRMVHSGRLPNAGTETAAKIWASTLPLKPGHLPYERSESQIATTSKEQIVRSAAAIERSRNAEEA